MTASVSHTELVTGAASSVSRAGPGFVTGGVGIALRLEGFATLAAAMAVYARSDFSWLAFAILFLTPDVAMLAYFAGHRVGALSYNFAHTYVLALALTLAGFFGGVPFAAAGGLIWIAHIGFDRALGYGLKYTTAFGDTHLSHVGRR